MVCDATSRISEKRDKIQCKPFIDNDRFIDAHVWRRIRFMFLGKVMFTEFRYRQSGGEPGPFGVLYAIAVAEERLRTLQAR